MLKSFPFFLLLIWNQMKSQSLANPDVQRLYDDLLIRYSPLVRPVKNPSDVLKVWFKIRLFQLLDIHEKNQIMTTNVWLSHEWYDFKLKWDPAKYGNVKIVYLPGDMIWRPDIVLYNNADGNPQVTHMTKATVHYTGKVQWNPPAIYKSMCPIDVRYFPYDQQTCHLKFGTWTHDGFGVDLLHMIENATEVTKFVAGDHIVVECIENGIDLKDYIRNTEWEILAVPGRKKRETYPCCPTPYVDITYEIHLRRKALFYTVNLIIPCAVISIMTVCIFFLPVIPNTKQKVTLSISILISLTVYFLLLVEIIPSTSLAVPLIVKFLLFTMVLVIGSIMLTVFTISLRYRSPAHHHMRPWMKKWFLERLPKLLYMQRPLPRLHLLVDHPQLKRAVNNKRLGGKIMPSDHDHEAFQFIRNPIVIDRPGEALDRAVHRLKHPQTLENGKCSPELVPQLIRALNNIQYIASHFRRLGKETQLRQDWKYVSMVVDRLFLILFLFVTTFGVLSILFHAPTWYDRRIALDQPGLDQYTAHSMNGIRYCKVPDQFAGGSGEKRMNP